MLSRFPSSRAASLLVAFARFRFLHRLHRATLRPVMLLGMVMPMREVLQMLLEVLVVHAAAPRPILHEWGRSAGGSEICERPPTKERRPRFDVKGIPTTRREWIDA